METNNEVRSKYVELAEFKGKANAYYQQLTKSAKQKGIGSMEHIYFTYGIEWAFNHLPQLQNEYDKLSADNEVLLSIAKEYYLHLQKAANENVKNAISTDSERAYLRNTISKITGIECEILQNEIESEAIQKADS